jgi:hypothetical protein
MMMTNDLDESIRIFCEATQQSVELPVARPVTFHRCWGSGESGSVMLHPTTMHGTRDSFVVSGTRENPDSAICDGDRSMLSKLAERVINYLRKFAR